MFGAYCGGQARCGSLSTALSPRAVLAVMVSAVVHGSYATGSEVLNEPSAVVRTVRVARVSATNFTRTRSLR